MFINKILFATLLFSFSSSYLFADEREDYDDEVAFEIIAEGGQTGVDHQMTMVVESMMHWEHLWKMHNKGLPVEVPMPKVDFTTETVLVQFLGPVASCGYDIYTRQIEDEGDYLKVKTVVEFPLGDINCLIAERPFEMIKVRRTGDIFLVKHKAID